MRKRETVPMRREKSGGGGGTEGDRVSEWPGVCRVPTPCGPTAGHAVRPGMCGMSPAHRGGFHAGPRCRRPVLTPAEELHLKGTQDEVLGDHKEECGGEKREWES